MRSAPSTPGRVLTLALLVGLPALPGCPARAQSSNPAAVQAVRAAVDSELANARTDKSVWMYRDADDVPGKNAVYNTIETPQGTLRRMIELDGRPLDPQQQQAETERLRHFVEDSSAQSRSRRNASHDGQQAEELLKMLPEGFLWTVAAETPETLTLNFAPNPQFHPPDIESRVFAAMGGQMVIARAGDRIQSLRGKLLSDIIFGLAIFGKLDKGGSFDVERRQVGGGHWQITETHVHIGGHALFFKTIGSQEDEVKTEWRPSPDPTLEAAARTLNAAG